VLLVEDSDVEDDYEDEKREGIDKARRRVGPHQQSKC